MSGVRNPLPDPPPNTPPDPPPNPPQTPHTRHSTRDERLQVQTLRNAGLNYSQIRAQLGLTLHQIAYAVQHRITPKKRKGRPTILTQQEIDDIITWICASKANRRVSWVQIPVILDLNIGQYAIRHALRNAGFS